MQNNFNSQLALAIPSYQWPDFRVEKVRPVHAYHDCIPFARGQRFSIRVIALLDAANVPFGL